MKRITKEPWFSKKMPVTRQGWAVLIGFFIVFYLSIGIVFINRTIGFILTFLDIIILLIIAILTNEDPQKQIDYKNPRILALILGLIIYIVTVYSSF